MSVTTVIENLDQARRHAARAACEGCRKEGTLAAYAVQKEGPNQGRLFSKCRHCGAFAWLTPARAADPELEQAQADARPCPKCGKGRHARRVSKDGPNQGRLFLACADPACDSFEWASLPPADQPAAPPRPAPAAGPRTAEALLAAIRDDPEDDATRLVYADWLDEHDQPARAQFIRVQVEHGHLALDDPARAGLDAQAQAILGAHEEAWVASLRPVAVRWRFVRGLVGEVEVTPERFPASAEQLLQAAPVAEFHVTVEGWQGVRTLVGCRRLLDVRRLVLLGGRMGGAGARVLAESPNVANLKALTLAGQSLGQPGVQALAGSRYLKNLEVLDLSDNSLSRSVVPILASSPNLPRLRRLVLARNLLKDSDARALAHSPHFPELQEVDLSGNDVSREGVEALTRSPRLPKLQRVVR
jgi:uncharacterized protein (TIGR02996 family)